MILSIFIYLYSIILALNNLAIRDLKDKIKSKISELKKLHDVDWLFLLLTLSSVLDVDLRLL
jgi:hypothetical protein